MSNFIVIPSITGLAMLVAGFLAHSRQVSEGSFKHWLTQCLAATLYSAGYSLIFAAGFVWLAMTNHWNQSNSNSIAYVAFYLPLFMAFITTFLVDIKYRDFGTSTLAMAIGTLSGLYIASAIAYML